MDETTRLVIATSLRAMFAKGWLDICTVDKCLRLAGIIPVAPEYKQLGALHCIHFSEMPRELADRIPAMLAQAFDGLNVQEMMKASEPALVANGSSMVKRLLGMNGSA